MRPVDPIADVGEWSEHLKTMDQTGRHVKVPERLVVEDECFVFAEGGRAHAGVYQDVEDRSIRAPHQFRLAGTGSAMQSTDHSILGARLRVLDERRSVDPMPSGNLGVERSGEEAPVVMVWRGLEHNDVGE